MAEHTPGDWRRASQDGFGIFAGNVCIASVHEIDGDVGGVQRRANSNLLAAAPRLLKALQELRAWAHYVPGRESPVEIEAGLAIAAATKQAPDA